VSVNFNLSKDLQILKKFFAKIKSSKNVLVFNSRIYTIKISLKSLTIRDNPCDQDLNKKQINYI